MKKIALLYYGLPDSHIFKKVWNNHKSYLIDNNPDCEFNIFMHHWLADISLKKWYPFYKKKEKIYHIDKQFITDNVHPVKYLFEIQENPFFKKYSKFVGDDFIVHKKGTKTDSPTLNNHASSKNLNKCLNLRMMSCVLSIYKCFNLVRDYEIEKNIKYKAIIIIRPDLWFFNKIKLNTYNLDKINVMSNKYSLGIARPLYFINKKSGKKSFPSFRFNFLTFSNRENMSIICNFFTNIKNILLKYPKKKKLAMPDCEIKIDPFVTNTGSLFYQYISSHFKISNIIFINKIIGIYRSKPRFNEAGVKIHFIYCPDNLLYLVNTLKRKDKVIMPVDARNYIGKNQNIYKFKL